MTIRKVWATRVNGASAETFVGKRGTIFFNELTGTLRISDGTTVGGNPLQLVASDFQFQFGDFEATTPGNGAATLMSVNPNQNIDIVSNGTGVINMVGDFHIHRTQDYDLNNYDIDGAVFAVKADGQIQMKVPLSDSTSGALEIIGNDTGLFVPPNQTGVIVHVTGNSGLPSRNYFDANQNYVVVAGRRYNGTQLAPTKVLNGEILLRIVGQAATQTGTEPATFQTLGPARIEYVTTQDQAPGAQGGEINIYATANNTAATSAVKVATFNGTTGLTATKFVGPLTGDVTGNVSGTAGSVAAANVTGTTLASNVVTSSLTSVGTLGSLAVTNTITAGLFDGKTKRTVRDAGTIADGGTVTINFLTDDVVLFVWGNGVNLAYSNYTAGRIVKVIARKATATGTDQFNLDGLTAANVSSGSTTFNGVADQSYFIELTCTNTSIGSVYAKV